MFVCHVVLFEYVSMDSFLDRVTFLSVTMVKWSYVTSIEIDLLIGIPYLFVFNTKVV